jgi:uncharacterized protein (DUF305 family)
MKRLLTATALALVAALALAGCGTNTDTSAGSSNAATFNDADVTFAQDMIPHHQQAVQMAKMAKANASTSEVTDLATKIEAAQGPEIDTMTGWLEQWDKPVPSGSGMNHDMGSMGDMPGMMTDENLMALDKANGASFDRMFLTMMIKHHEGAIEMARTEQADGKNADALALAKKIEADQTAEIDTMNRLLDGLPQS